MLFWTYDAKLDAILQNQQRILALLYRLTAKEQQIMVDVSQITAEVANNTTVTQSVVALIQALAAQIAAIPPSSDPATQAALDQLTSTLTANDGTLAAAVTANTKTPAGS